VDLNVRQHSGEYMKKKNHRVAGMGR